MTQFRPRETPTAAGVGEDVRVVTWSRQEALLLRDHDQGAQPLTHARMVVWLVDAAFIGAGFGDCNKRNPASTMVTGMESRLRVDSTG